MAIFYCEIEEDLIQLGTHCIPVDRVKLPLQVQAESYMSTGLTWAQIYECFERFCRENQFIVGTSGSCHAFGERHTVADLTQYVYVESKSDHFIFQIWTMIEKNESASEAEKNDYLIDVQPYMTSQRICSTSVFIEEVFENRSPEMYFGDLKVFESTILEGQALLWTTYQKDSQGRELFVVIPTSLQGRNKLESHAQETADGIIHLETYFHLITLPKNRFHIVSEEIKELESEMQKTIIEITENLTTRDPDRFREWLKDLSVNFAQLNGYKEEIERHAVNMQLYQDEVDGLLTWWKEEPAETEVSLSQVVKSNIVRFSRDYTWVFRRIGDLSSSMDNMLGILRTRMDILNQRQLLSNQKRIQASLDAQLKTHHNLQGLYSVFCAFYFTEISYVIFEAMHDKDWIHISAALATAPLIPLFLILGLFLSGTAKRLLGKKEELEITE